MAGKSHNISKGLKSLIERIERLEEEKSALSEDIKEVYTEAKALSHDVKTLRKIIALRKKEKEKVQEEQENLVMMADAIDPALGRALRTE